MNKQQLKKCFDRITPGEELMRSTLEAVHAAQAGQGQTVRSMPRYAFATRLAGAACALVLVVGLGVTIARQSATSPLLSEEGRGVDLLPANEGPLEPSEQADDAVFDSLDHLIAAAQAEGGDWMVLEGRVDAFYAEPDKHPGTGRMSVATKGLLDAQTSDDVLLPATDGQLLDVDAKVSDALFNVIGADAYLYLTASEQDGQTVWTLSGFAFVD